MQWSMYKYDDIFCSFYCCRDHIQSYSKSSIVILTNKSFFCDIPCSRIFDDSMQVCMYFVEKYCLYVWCNLIWLEVYLCEYVHTMLFSLSIVDRLNFANQWQIAFLKFRFSYTPTHLLIIFLRFPIVDWHASKYEK